MNEIEKINNPVCKYCQSSHVNKYGTYKGIQRYFCCDCNRKFVSGDTIPAMQTPTKVIADSLNMHYEGMSLNEIRRNFIQQDGNYVSKVTPYNWEKRFTKIALDEAIKYQPNVGEVWQADETVIHNNFSGKKKKLWLIDIIDRDTRFILCSKPSLTRSKQDIKSALEHAHKVCGEVPKKILTDGWRGYPDGIELAFGAETKHISTTPFEEKDLSTNIVERVQGTLKERTKVMRGLKTLESINDFLQGWVIHYNFFRPHLSLNDRTPAQMAGIKFPYANWKELIEKQPYSVTARISTSPRPPRITPRASRITPKPPRITPKAPRITPKMPKLK
jgi:putative transposase